MAGDANYPNVVLLLPMTGANNSTVFTDTSLSARTGTAVGNAKVDAASNDPFGGTTGIATFDGAGDSIEFPISSDFDFTSPYTIELWVNRTGNGTTISTIIGNLSDTTLTGWRLDAGLTSGATWAYAYFGTDSNVYGVTGGALTSNTFYHIAVSFDGSDIRAFTNGTLNNTTTTSIYPKSSNKKVMLGMQVDSTRYFTGKQAHLRITRACRYTASFTAPTAPFLPYYGQLTGSVTEGSYSYISKWLVKAWKSFSGTFYKEQVVTGTTYTLDLPTLDPYVLACAPYIDGKWEANKVVTLNQFYTTSNPETSAHLWEVTTAGTFDTTEATWNLSGTTTQGTATMTYVGALPNPSILGPKIPS